MSSIGGGGTERRNANSFTIFDADLGAIFSAGAMFTARGFSYSTIRALVVAGIDAPERLLFATDTDLLSIPGIDETAFKEIARSRARFATADYGATFQAPSAAPQVSPDLLLQAIAVP